MYYRQSPKQLLLPNEFVNYVKTLILKKAIAFLFLTTILYDNIWKNFSKYIFSL